MAWETEEARVLANEHTDPTLGHLVIAAPAISRLAEPGQFVELCPSLTGDPLLPRPFDVHYADAAKGELEVIYRVKGRGTHLLQDLAEGEPLAVNGPFGKSLDPLLRRGGSIALIGRGAGISPLYFVALRAKAYGGSVRAYLSARTRHLLIPFEKLNGVAEIITHTDEARPGHLVTDDFARDLRHTAVDSAFVAGSRRLAQATVQLGYDHGFTAYGYAESYMACGFGHCKACAVPTVHGYLLNCLDGPVLNLGEVTDEYWTSIPR